jgi:hypothetical protein
MGKAFPYVPGQVATQLFVDHGHFIDRWSWLDFHRLAFKREDWGLEEFQASGVLQNSVVRYFASQRGSNPSTKRKRRLDACFRNHGTWPVPPVLIRLTGALGPIPSWVEQSGPWLLMEGHYRIGMLLRWHDQLPATQVHGLWLATACEQKPE